MANSGWYQSSAVPSGFGFHLGLPINVTQISDKDRTFVDEGRQTYHAHAANGPQKCDEATKSFIEANAGIPFVIKIYTRDADNAPKKRTIKEALKAKGALKLNLIVTVAGKV